MSQTSAGRALELIFRPALTITESADDYDSLVRSLQQAISPAHQLQHSHGDAVRNLIGRVAIIEMVGPVLMVESPI